MKVKVGEKTFTITFSHTSVDMFSVTHQGESYTSKVRSIGTAERMMGKRFHLTPSEAMKLTDLIIDSYLIWRRKKEA